MLQSNGTNARSGMALARIAGSSASEGTDDASKRTCHVRAWRWTSHTEALLKSTHGPAILTLTSRFICGVNAHRPHRVRPFGTTPKNSPTRSKSHAGPS
ncbi:hypothetical protein [Xanthomonas axonopodis]|uniref:hypothetical protein n=1 Tax=Xanthomonas axonopodis TaxID=53413 RepID=UPI00215752EB|nr:hypothetical protein [Xanthomonas axonopodis]